MASKQTEQEYSISNIADIIEMSRESVRRYIQLGMLQAEKRGKSYMIRKIDLVRFLNAEGRIKSKGSTEEAGREGIRNDIK